MLRVAGLALLLPQTALAQQEISAVNYVCDRDVMLHAIYMHGQDLNQVLIKTEASQVLLPGKRTASGARYGQSSNGTGFVWWTKGDEATLYWKTPEGETPLLTCKTAG